MDERETIGTRLRELREAREQSCQGVVIALAHRGLKISRELLVKWERDQRVPNGEAVVALADYYGTTTDYILGVSAVKLSVDCMLITADTLGLSRRATENLVRISDLRGGRASDLLSAVLESPLLPELMSAMVSSQDGIHRQRRLLEQDKGTGAEGALRPTPVRLVNSGLDMADMYVLRATRSAEKLLREVLGYTELARRARQGEHQERSL